VNGELVGTPSIGIMTSAFADGAELMAAALGAPGYRFVVIEHPISSATDAALEARARDTLRQAAELLRPTA
jgi:2-methylaconitate cis-trans-isomerase PrpF